MGGGNLSLQVHPTTGCAQDRFGMAYTQDESYYILDASPDSHVCLGLHGDVTREGFEGTLRRVQAGERGPSTPSAGATAFPRRVTTT